MELLQILRAVTYSINIFVLEQHSWPLLTLLVCPDWPDVMGQDKKTQSDAVQDHQVQDWCPVWSSCCGKPLLFQSYRLVSSTRPTLLRSPQLLLVWMLLVVCWMCEGVVVVVVAGVMCSCDIWSTLIFPFTTLPNISTVMAHTFITTTLPPLSTRPVLADIKHCPGLVNSSSLCLTPL